MIPKERLLDKIRLVYTSCINAPSSLFTEQLNDYLRELHTAVIFESVNNHALEEKNNDEKVLALNSSSQNILKLLNQIRQEITSYFNKHNIVVSNKFAYQFIECKNSNPAVFPLPIEEHISLIDEILGKGIKIEQDHISTLIDFCINALEHLMTGEGEKFKNEIQVLLKELIIQDKDGNSVRVKDTTPDGLQQTHLKISNFIDANKILNPHIHMVLSEFDNYNNTEDETLHKNGCVISVLISLDQDTLYTSHHLDFVKNFAVIDKKGNIAGLKITDAIHDWRSKKDNLERIKTSRFWYAWQELQHVFKIDNDFEILRFKALQEGDLLEEWHLCKDMKKIKGIPLGSQKDYVEQLKKHAKKVFLYIEPLLSLNITRPIIMEQNSAPKNNSVSSEGKGSSSLIADIPAKKKVVFIQITASLDEENGNLILLKNDNEDTVSDSEKKTFRKYDKKKQTLQFRILILLYHFPTGLSIKKLAKLLRVKPRAISDTYPRINRKLQDYIILESGKLIFESTKYLTTCTFSIENVIKDLDLDASHLSILLNKRS